MRLQQKKRSERPQRCQWPKEFEVSNHDNQIFTNGMVGRITRCYGPRNWWYSNDPLVVIDGVPDRDDGKEPIEPD